MGVGLLIMRYSPPQVIYVENSVVEKVNMDWLRLKYMVQLWPKFHPFNIYFSRVAKINGNIDPEYR